MNEEERQHLEKLRQINTERLRILEQQKAHFGKLAPPYISMDINDVQQQIQAINEQLADAGPRRSEHELMNATPGINSGGGSIIQGDVSAGGNFVGRDNTQININLSPINMQKQAIQAILSACYRRAIFTKTPLEMDTGAMFDSLIACRNRILPLIPKIDSANLQQLASNIIAVLDEIEMRRKFHQHNTWTDWHIVEEIDDLKRLMLSLLFQLADGAELAYVLPTALSNDRYFTREDADRPPH